MKTNTIKILKKPNSSNTKSVKIKAPLYTTYRKKSYSGYHTLL